MSYLVPFEKIAKGLRELADQLPENHLSLASDALQAMCDNPTAIYQETRRRLTVDLGFPINVADAFIAEDGSNGDVDEMARIATYPSDRVARILESWCKEALRIRGIKVYPTEKSWAKLTIILREEP